MKESKNNTLYFPITINEENWSYWGEAKFFDWCFSEWNTLEEYWNNMTEAISLYSEALNDGTFNIPNTWILWINIDNNGKIKNNILKRINKDSYKTLSYSK